MMGLLEVLSSTVNTLVLPHLETLNQTMFVDIIDLQTTIVMVSRARDMSYYVGEEIRKLREDT